MDQVIDSLDITLISIVNNGELITNGSFMIAFFEYLITMLPLFIEY